MRRGVQEEVLFHTNESARLSGGKMFVLQVLELWGREESNQRSLYVE